MRNGENGSIVLATIAEALDNGCGTPHDEEGAAADVVELLDKRGFVIVNREKIAGPLVQLRELLRTLDSAEDGLRAGVSDMDLGVLYTDARARLIDRARDLASVLPEIEEPF